jgi:hypothetical protein
MRAFNFLLFIAFMTMLLSCRKDELIVDEYIIVTEEEVPELTKANLTIIENKLIFKNPNDVEKIEIDLGTVPLKIGINKPISVSIPSNDFDSSKDLSDLILEVKNYGKVNEPVEGVLSAKLTKGTVVSDFKMKFNVFLMDDLQMICGKVWYESIPNNVLDLNENGVNGLKVKIEFNGAIYAIMQTGLKPSTIFDDGYFEFLASTAYPNTISLVNVPSTLKQVIKNFGPDDAVNGDFDENHQVKDLVVKKGEKISLLAGLVPK